MNVGGVILRLVVGFFVLVSAAGTAYAEDQESLAELVTRVGRARWTHDNAIELLADPNRAWEARVELVEQSRHHLFISTFSWHNDTFGKEFRHIVLDALDDRLESGLDYSVHVLADASALAAWSIAFRGLERRGADVRGFNRSSWGLTPLYEGRMHDKILISDGRSAIVGGRNYADDYFDPDKWWLDLGVKLEGSAVDDLQMIFLKSWEFTEFNRKTGRFLMPQELLLDRLRVFWETGRYPNGNSPLEPFVNREYFPVRNEAPGTTSVAILYDNPLLKRPAASSELLAALVRRAEHRVELMTPFPNLFEDLTAALEEAVARGVTVRILVNDHEAAIRGGPFLWAAYPTLIRLVEVGAEVWAWHGNGDLRKALENGACRPVYMPPVALHGKMLLIDEEISIIHSSNFNIRSTYYNTEAGVAVLDPQFNRQLGDLVDGLIGLRDAEVACVDSDQTLRVPAILRLFGPEDVPRMKKELGRKQPFLDAWSVAW